MPANASADSRHVSALSPAGSRLRHFCFRPGETRSGSRSLGVGGELGSWAWVKAATRGSRSVSPSGVAASPPRCARARLLTGARNRPASRRCRNWPINASLANGGVETCFRSCRGICQPRDARPPLSGCGSPLERSRSPHRVCLMSPTNVDGVAQLLRCQLPSGDTGYSTLICWPSGSTAMIP